MVRKFYISYENMYMFYVGPGKSVISKCAQYKFVTRCVYANVITQLWRIHYESIFVILVWLLYFCSSESITIKSSVSFVCCRGGIVSKDI